MANLTKRRADCLAWYARNADIASPKGRTVSPDEQKKWNNAELHWCLEQEFLRVGPNGWHVPTKAGLDAFDKWRRGKALAKFAVGTP